MPQVAGIVDVTTIQGYDPMMGTDPRVIPVDITLAEICAAFPGLSVFTIKGGAIVEIGGAAANPYAWRLNKLGMPSKLRTKGIAVADQSAQWAARMKSSRESSHNANSPR